VPREGSYGSEQHPTRGGGQSSHGSQFFTPVISMLQLPNLVGWPNLLRHRILLVNPTHPTSGCSAPKSKVCITTIFMQIVQPRASKIVRMTHQGHIVDTCGRLHPRWGNWGLKTSVFHTCYVCCGW